MTATATATVPAAAITAPAAATPLRIALVGASGYVGSAIREEALARGHQVTALVSRPDRLAPAGRLSVRGIDANDADALAATFAGHDLAITAFSGHAQADVRGAYVKGLRAIVDAAKRAGLRLLVVGGAGSLEVAPGVQLVDTPGFPDQWKGSAEGARDGLRLLQAEAGLAWSMLSPSAFLEPGARTGVFRLGGDQLLVGADGRSAISTADYAAAMLDEAERPAHTGRRFTVGR